MIFLSLSSQLELLQTTLRSVNKGPYLKKIEGNVSCKDFTARNQFLKSALQKYSFFYLNGKCLEMHQAQYNQHIACEESC
jgi:hypothetical protein